MFIEKTLSPVKNNAFVEQQIQEAGQQENYFGLLMELESMTEESPLKSSSGMQENEKKHSEHKQDDTVQSRNTSQASQPPAPLTCQPQPLKDLSGKKSMHQPAILPPPPPLSRGYTAVTMTTQEDTIVSQPSALGMDANISR